MWGTSSPDDKLTGDLGNVIEATESGDRQLIRVTAEKLSPDNFRLLQQYRHEADLLTAPVDVCLSGGLCCKSSFALGFKNSEGCGRGFRVKM